MLSPARGRGGTRPFLRSGLLASLLLVGSACAPGEEGTDSSAVTGRLEAIFEEVWSESVRRSSRLRMQEGLPIDQLDDLSAAASREAVEKARGWLERLRALDVDSLPHAAWVDARALEWDLEMVVEGERWFWHASVLTPYSSPLPTAAQVLSSLPLGTEEERIDYLHLLQQVPDFLAQLEARVRGQAERGIYVWRHGYDASLGLLRSLRSDGAGGPLAVSEERLTPLDDESRAELVRQAAAVIDGPIDAALESLLTFLEGDYAAQTPVEVGARQLPDGEAWYRFRVRRMTTVETAPEEIHQRGLALVAEMESEMAALRERTGFAGTREEFRAALRREPQYFPETPEEVAQRLLDAAEAMEAVLDRYFLTRPEADYGVKRLEASYEGSQTYGVYEPPRVGDPVGRYRYNGSKLDERSWLNLRAVSLHELVPGHHFHIARQMESEALPDYRRNTWHTAYTEGWGSYASYLGLEAGIYEGDPLSAYGMYVLEIFLATRLVVDTGMNLLGWTLEEGREYMRAHTLESETQIRTESLRYAADMPGQALAYQMGKLQLLALRERASQRLGDRFDLRAFHEAILEPGSLPMTVLEEHVDWWIEQQ